MVGPREQCVRVLRSFPGHCHLAAAWRERATYKLGRSLEGITFTSCLEPCASPPGSALRMPTSRGSASQRSQLNAIRCRAGCVCGTCRVLCSAPRWTRGVSRSRVGWVPPGIPDRRDGQPRTRKSLTQPSSALQLLSEGLRRTAVWTKAISRPREREIQLRNSPRFGHCRGPSLTFTVVTHHSRAAW